MTAPTMNILTSLRKAIEALKTLSEKDFATADRKAFALRAFHEVNHAAFFDPTYGDGFAWAEDSDTAGCDLESVCEAVEIEAGQIVQLTRVASLPDIFVVAVEDANGDLELEAYDSETEAETRANAAEGSSA